MPKTVAILAKAGSKEIARMARKVYETLRANGLTVVPDENLARAERLPDGKRISQIRADLLVTVGGDGTVLKAVREIPEPRTPILGVNMGRRGYLTEVNPAGLEAAIARWKQGRFQLERLWKLAVWSGNKLVGEGLNEGLLTPAVPAKMLSLDILLHGHPSYGGRADGLIVATPTGSTAHAFSAGGPVLESSLDNFSVTFIAPLHPLTSLVIPVGSRLSVRVGRPGPDANLSIDGQFQRSVKAGYSVSFRRSKNSSFFVRFDDTFLQRSLRRLSPERETL